MISPDSPAFKAFAGSTALLAAKMIVMSPLTARQRFKHQTFISSEDGKLTPDAKIGGANPDIERVRRAHQNDLENIPIFILLGGVYLNVVKNPCINPAYLYYGFTAARYMHTLVYLNEVRQPTRALSWAAGFAISAFMAGSVLYELFM